MKLEDQTYRYIYKSLANSIIKNIEEYESNEADIENSKDNVHRLIKMLNFLTISDNLFTHPQRILIAPNFIALIDMTSIEGDKMSITTVEKAPNIKDNYL